VSRFGFGVRGSVSGVRCSVLGVGCSGSGVGCWVFGVRAGVDLVGRGQRLALPPREVEAELGTPLRQRLWGYLGISPM